MTLLPLPFLFLFLTSLPFSVISQLDERSTLLTLKRGLGDPPSLRLWNTTSTPCDWSEITCVSGNVTGISLKNKIITATVPTNICDFPNLETLDLSSNRFSGDFPTVLYNCTKLRHLDLSQNYFNCTLPADINRLSPQLELLNLGANAFSGDIPTELTSLSKLKSIFLDSNNLSGELPEEIISWKSLVTLSLSKNKLSGKIPRALGLLPRLVDLDLSENKLSGEIPPEIGNLKFKTLNFSSNMLTGEVPDKLDNLAYETSFLNNTNLCADKPVVKLQDCRKVLRRSKRLPGTIFVVIVVIGALILAVTLVLTFVVVWNYIRKPRTSRPRDVNWALPSRPVLNRCGFVFSRDRPVRDAVLKLAAQCRTAKCVGLRGPSRGTSQKNMILAASSCFCFYG